MRTELAVRAPTQPSSRALAHQGRPQALMGGARLSLILTATVFVALEPSLPHRPVDRLRDFLFDLIGVAVGVAFVVVS